MMKSLSVKRLLITLFQIIGASLITLLIATLMLKHTNDLNQWREVFSRFQHAFFIIHGLFYIALYYFWPAFVNCIAARQHSTLKQVKKAMHARVYLISTLLMFELLNLLR